MRKREGDVFLCVREEPGNTNTLGSSRETTLNCPKLTKEGSSQKMKRLITQLKSLYTNMGSMGNKQEEQETSSSIAPEWCNSKPIIQLLSQKLGGMNHTTGTLQSRATTFSEKEGWEGRADMFCSVLRSAKALSILLKKSWKSGKVPSDQKR